MSEMALELIRQAKAEGWKRLDLGKTGILGEVPAAAGKESLIVYPKRKK